MKNYKNRKQMDLCDRFAIEVGLGKGDSFKKIAKKLGRHPSTISREVKENRTYMGNRFPEGNDCRYARQCKIKNLCAEDPGGCRSFCKYCRVTDCRKICSRYESQACIETMKPPYVCNKCAQRRVCNKDRYFYTAKYAEAGVSRRRSESRAGIRIRGGQLREMDELITRLVNKGQPLTHIYAEHEAEIPIGLRSLYNYIDAGVLSIRNIDLRRKTGYKARKKRRGRTKAEYQAYRQGRTYNNYLADSKYFSEADVVEMDTVKGGWEKGKRLLTMIFRKNHIMLMFLMPDGTAGSVKRVFDYLETGLGTECFRRLFGIILTDNGSEFKRVDELERTDDLTCRTKIYFCDPMASWQKGHIEKNHEFIRYVIPRGRSLNKFEQKDMILLMNHINSTKRAGLGNKAPYELVPPDDEDMKALFRLLKMNFIPPDEVHLKPDLFSFNK